MVRNRTFVFHRRAEVGGGEIIALPGPFRAPPGARSRVRRLMNSDAVLAFRPSTAGSLRFLSEPHKEMKRASERRRGLSSATERSVGEEVSHRFRLDYLSV